MSAPVALTERSLISGARDGGMLFEILAPVGFLAGLTVALHGLVDTAA